jgi:hypothetical protein
MNRAKEIGIKHRIPVWRRGDFKNMRTESDRSMPGTRGARLGARQRFCEMAGVLVAAYALSGFMVAQVSGADPQAAVSGGIAPGAQAAAPATSTSTNSAPADNPTPPPAANPKLSAAELEKLLMPIALYPDPLIATMLPASVYPLEIVQAARFVSDTNNISKIDQQSWDENVKAVAKIPDAVKKMNDDLQWTISLGEAFLNQDKDVMDTIQALRNKAQKAGTLQTTEQQTIVVTNMVVEKTVEQQVVVVTNTVVQIKPTNPEVVYVPSYPPAVYYPPPGYVYAPGAAFMTFAAGVTMGAIIANNCDWHHGGCYNGGNVNVNNNVNINGGDRNNINGGDRNNANRGNNRGASATASSQGKKWQPDQSRLKSSGSPTASKSMDSRGWGGGSGAGAGARPGANNVAAGGGARGGASASARPAGAGPAARPSTGAARPAGTSPSASSRPSSPAAAGGGAGNRSAGSPGATSRGGGGGSSAFAGGGGGGGGSDRSVSQRGASSRGGGGLSGGGGGGRSGGGGGGRGGGGGGRGGGGRR